MRHRVYSAAHMIHDHSTTLYKLSTNSWLTWTHDITAHCASVLCPCLHIVPWQMILNTLTAQTLKATKCQHSKWQVLIIKVCDGGDNDHGYSNMWQLLMRTKHDRPLNLHCIIRTQWPETSLTSVKSLEEVNTGLSTQYCPTQSPMYTLHEHRPIHPVLSYTITNTHTSLGSLPTLLAPV